MSATRTDDCSTRQGGLYMALELGEKRWKVGFTTGLGQPLRQREVPGRTISVSPASLTLPGKKNFGHGGLTNADA